MISQRKPGGYLVWLSTAAALLTACVVAPGWAGEKGKFRAQGALVTIRQETAKVDDQPEHVLYFMEYEGVLFGVSEGSLLDKARYQAVFLSDTAGMVSGGYKTFTMPDGSKIFAKFSETEVKHPVYKGTWQFTGGTGKYQGVKGHGQYTYTSISEKAGTDLLEGEYELP